MVRLLNSFTLTTLEATFIAFGPDKRTIPIPPLPLGVATATIVSVNTLVLARVYVLSLSTTCRALRSSLEEEARDVRQAALQERLDTESIDARLQVLARVSELHGAALAEHAGLLLVQLADPEDEVREAVAALVRRLPVAVLLEHVPALLKLLDRATGVKDVLPKMQRLKEGGDSKYKGLIYIGNKDEGVPTPY